MRRYTIYFKFGDSFLPMINCHTLNDVAGHLMSDMDRPSFKVFDNKKDQWTDHNLIFLACITHKEVANETI